MLSISDVSVITNGTEIGQSSDTGTLRRGLDVEGSRHFGLKADSEVNTQPEGI